MESSSSKRPNLPPASEETRRFSFLLEQELLSWPGVSKRPMFGLYAFYRGEAIFAALPYKRGYESPTGLGYKLSHPGQRTEGEKWKSLELNSEGDITTALDYLEKAYRAIGKRSR